MRRTVILFLIAVLLLGAVGCTTTITYDAPSQLNPLPQDGPRVAVLQVKEPRHRRYHHGVAAKFPPRDVGYSLTNAVHGILDSSGLFAEVTTVDRVSLDSLSMDDLSRRGYDYVFVSELVSLRIERSLHPWGFVAPPCWLAAFGVPIFPSCGNASMQFRGELVDITSAQTVARLDTGLWRRDYPYLWVSYTNAHAVTQRLLDDAVRGCLSQFQERTAQFAKVLNGSDTNVKNTRPCPPKRTAPESPPARIWAVVVGVGEYQNKTVPKLEFSGTDAGRVTDWLKSVPNAKALVLLDEQATRENIVTAIGTWLKRKALPEDMVIVYYSGHGAPESVTSGEEKGSAAKYLVPYNANPQNLLASAVSMDDISKLLDRCRADRQVVILDACFAGAAFRKEGEKNLRISPRPIADLASRRGRVVITSSGANEISKESKKLKGSIFTHYLIEGLKSQSNTVTFRKAFNYLYNPVRRKAQEEDATQTPQWKGEGNLEFLLTR